ncbi:hypothetical protein COOONC_01084 [Cooperia oncophora]
MTTRAAILLLLGTSVVYAKSKQDRRVIEFPGKEQWAQEYLDLCDKTTYAELDTEGSEDDVFGCTTYLWNYELVKVELLQVFPPIIVYRGFAPRKYLRDFLSDVRSAKAKSPDINVDEESQLQATEIELKHREKAGVARLFNRLKRFIPFVNFDSSDPWQVLIFKNNQHRAPRHDYLASEEERAEDRLLDKLGNRFATFLVALKTAQLGGGTVFPLIEQNYKLQAGDVLMWTNMDTSKAKEIGSDYGDCPVKKGEKVVATLRLREHGQYLLKSVLPGGFYDFEMLFQPNLTNLERNPTNLLDNFLDESDYDYYPANY